MKSVILVHGAWHGSWCWEKVQQLLSNAGIPSFAVELPFTGFIDDVAEVEATIAHVGAPSVLLGHSYGGKVISQAAEGKSEITNLIYLCAFLLREGESFAGTGQEPHPSSIKLEVGKDLSCTVRSDAIVPAFYADVDSMTAKRASSMLRPLPISSFEPGRGEAWNDITTTYVVCSDDAAIHPDRQRQMASLADHVVEWESGHSPFFSDPELVVNLLSDYVH